MMQTNRVLDYSDKSCPVLTKVDVVAELSYNRKLIFMTKQSKLLLRCNMLSSLIKLFLLLEMEDCFTSRILHTSVVKQGYLCW